MHKLLEMVIGALNRDERLCIATVIRRTGSAPREVGAKCLVGAEGLLWGSVGGGKLEKEVLAYSKGVIEERAPRLLIFRLDNTNLAQEGMICGGNVDIFLEPVLPEHIFFWQEIKKLLEGKRGDLRVLTSVDPKKWAKGCYPKWVVDREKILVGELSNEVLDVIAKNQWIWDRWGAQLLEGDLFVETLSEIPRLVIFGAGHIGRYLAQISNLLEWETVVIDDTEHFLDPQLFPSGTKLILCPFQSVLSYVDLTKEDLVVIVTRGHLNDRDVLEQVLKVEPLYVGMIGSKRKRDMIFEYLREKGFSDEKLAQVRSPIGLQIGAETPQEIAISIVAEIIQVKRGSVLTKGARLSTGP